MKSNMPPRLMSFVEQLLNNHLYFLDRNTGVTNNPQTDCYVLNPDGVLANNRHLIDYTAMQGMPSNDSTTEGQSLLVLGFIYAYYATKDQRFLERAEFYADAYFKYFYAGKAPPATGEWHCNWICNGKEPFLASWPLDPEFPTHSGFKGVVFNWVNGKIQIPHGAPYWGQFLDVATFAFDGELNWPAINASTHATDDWNRDGVEYPIDYIVDYRQRKVSGAGDVLAENYTAEPKGTVVLVDKTVNGAHKLNFANAQPVEYGGYLIKRNEIYHNRPLRVPLPSGFEGNASDAEVWFYDACHHLYKITKKQKYLDAKNAIYRTIISYINIGRDDRFFRQTKAASTPFTDGVAYDYFYPTTAKATLSYGRDSDGYITVRQTAESQSTIEQNAITFYTKAESNLIVNAQAKRISDNAPAKIDCFISLTENIEGNNEKRYRAPLNPNVMTNVIRMANLISTTTATGSEAILAQDSAVVAYGTKKYSFDYESNVVDFRSDFVCNFQMLTADDECIIGFWSLAQTQQELRTFYYQTEKPVRLSMTDSAGWRWGLNIQPTNGWVMLAIGRGSWTLNSWQSNTGTPPATPVSYAVTQFKVYPLNFTEPFRFKWYCVNDLPPMFGIYYPNKYTKTFSLRFYSDAQGINARVGDCYFENIQENFLHYTPGVIPFGNITSPYSPVYSGWRGLPYPGYQYPFVFINENSPLKNSYIQNQINFLYAAQMAYKVQFGVVGPCAAAYVWNRWDNLTYGPANTWLFGHWGKDAWAGYQARAFYAAARAQYELTRESFTPNSTLSTFLNNFLNYLYNFTLLNGAPPTEFPMDRPAYRPPGDINPHMHGLWLAGLSLISLSGINNNKNIGWLMESLANDLSNAFVCDSQDNIMNGSWSPWAGGGMYFGFYTGEVMRGLSLYMLALNGSKEH